MGRRRSLATEDHVRAFTEAGDGLIIELIFSLADPAGGGILPYPIKLS